MRIDTILVATVCAGIFYTFGLRVFDKEDLMASVCFILSIAINGVLILANFWSVAWNEFCAYQLIKEDQIETCTHVRVKVINKKQNTIKRFIVPLMIKSVIIEGKVNKAQQIEVQKKKFIFKKDKKTFT
jgi:cation-transporting ATPase 13A1